MRGVIEELLAVEFLSTTTHSRSLVATTTILLGVTKSPSTISKVSSPKKESLYVEATYSSCVQASSFVLIHTMQGPARGQLTDMVKVWNRADKSIGYVKAYTGLDTEARDAHKSKYNWPGFAQSEESVKWLWDNQFAAVAADNPAFDCTREHLLSMNIAWLYTDPFAAPADPKYFLHPILLAGWGTPIGELFDLEKLSETCKKLNRWTFFFSSAPLNYTGVVASPPNALAFFWGIKNYFYRKQYKTN